jgi:hypothetical protein
LELQAPQSANNQSQNANIAHKADPVAAAQATEKTNKKNQAKSKAMVKNSKIYQPKSRKW